MARSGDIPLEPPVNAHPENVPAQEDRSYLWFMAAALASALAGGFLLAVWVPLAATDSAPGATRLPWLIQAHGWAQLQGWAGLFVAGMGIRLLPRFAGRKPVPRTLTLPVLGLLAIPVVIRLTVQPWAEGAAAEAAAWATGLSTAGGAAGFAAILAWTLAKGRRAREPWRYFAIAGSSWWAAWAALALFHAADAAGNDGLAPPLDSGILAWVVMLGPIGNFIWSVQSRSVPIFFGRKTPSWRAVAAQGIAVNAGAALLALSLWVDGTVGVRAEGAGFALAGLGLMALPPLAGAVRGQAIRLRPRARPAARFVLAANVAAVLAGVLLAWNGLATLAQGERTASYAIDSARHLYGIGLITMLIPGMARLVAPVFALERTESGVPRLYERLPFWFLLAALVLRSGPALFAEQLDYDLRMHLASAAGVLGWAAIVIFALSVLRAVRAEPRTRQALEQLVRPA